MNTLQHNPFDLGREYALVFCRPELFGPKGFKSYTDFNFFASRARYLLTAVADSHLEDMFRFSDHSGEIGPMLPAWAVTAAAWMAGIQKNRIFIPQLTALIQTDEYAGNFSLAWHAAGLLFDDPELHVLYHRAFEKKEEEAAPARDEFAHDSRALAIVSLELLDQRHGTRHAEALSDDLAPDQRERTRLRLKKILEVSEMLRAGMDCSDPADLRSKLTKFLSISTSHRQHAMGAMTPVRIRNRLEVPDGWATPEVYWISQMEKFRDTHKVYFNLRMTVPHSEVKEFLERIDCELGRDEPSVQRDDLLRRHVNEYLASGKSDAFWLWITGRAANDVFDILAALELDIGLRLPADFVDYLYGKLLDLIPFDADGYRQYAYDLLLRSSAYDNKAAELLKKADEIDAQVKAHAKYPGVRISFVQKSPKNTQDKTLNATSRMLSLIKEAASDLIGLGRG